MNLASTLATFVNAKVRKRGVHYFRGRRVRLTVCGPEKAEATVSGSSVYRVLLDRDGQALEASCSCPYFSRSEPCKHIWAAILAVDAKGGLLGAAGTPPRKLTTGAETEPPKAPGRETPAGKPAPPPPQPDWREVLDRLAKAGDSPAPASTSGTILYVVDAPATLQSQRLTLQILTGRIKRDGSLGKLHSLRLNRNDLPCVSDPADREILSLLAGAALGGIWRYYTSTLSPPHTVKSRTRLPAPCCP